jgi:GR25 family glycosyltransferase involved in LPS biosynthesis
MSFLKNSLNKICMFEKIYCINFLEAAERREFMSKQFKEIGLDVEFFNAINYSKIKFMYPVKKTKLRNMHKVLGCALSHYTCVKSAKLLGYKNVLILEDDTCFIKDTLLLKEYLNNLPADWDYIKYSLCHSEYRNINALYKTVNNINENYFLIKKELPAWFSSNCSGAYALNEKMMDYYINIFENSKLTPADKIQYINFDFHKSPFNCYAPNIALMYPQICLGKARYCPEERKYPTFNAVPLHKINVEHFNQPKEFLNSTIAPGER